jgi:hypothetical protein
LLKVLAYKRKKNVLFMFFLQLENDRKLVLENCEKPLKCFSNSKQIWDGEYCILIESSFFSFLVFNFFFIKKIKYYFISEQLLSLLEY